MGVAIKHVLIKTLIFTVLVTLIGCNEVIEPETVDSSNASSSQASMETVAVNITIPSTHTLDSSLPSGLSLQGTLISGTVAKNSTLSIKLTADCYDPINYVHVNVKNPISTVLAAPTIKKYEVEITANANGSDITDDITLSGISSNPAQIDCGTSLSITASHSDYPNTYATATITEDTVIEMNDWIVSSISFPTKTRDTYYFNELSSADRTVTVTHNGTMTCSTDGTTYGSCNSSTTMLWTQPSNQTKYIKITKDNSDDKTYSFNPHDDRATIGFATYDCTITVTDGDGSMTFKEFEEYEASGQNMLYNATSTEKVICVSNVSSIKTTSLPEGIELRANGAAGKRLILIAREGSDLVIDNSNLTATGTNKYGFDIINGGHSTLVGFKVITRADGGYGIRVNAAAPKVELRHLEIETTGNSQANGIVNWTEGVEMKDIKITTNGSPDCHGIVSTASNFTWEDLDITINDTGRGLALTEVSDATIKNSILRGGGMSGAFILDPTGSITFEGTTFTSDDNKAAWVRSYNTASNGGPVIFKDSTFYNDKDSPSVVSYVETNNTNPTTQVKAVFLNNTFKSYNGRSGIWNGDSQVYVNGNNFARMIGTYTITNEPAIKSNNLNGTHNQVITSMEDDNTACYQNGSVAWPGFLLGATNSGNFLGANQENHSTNTDIYNCSYYGISL